MKIIIVGPVYPYKGGISHYTGLLAKNLSENHDVQVVSFRLQYPKFLYRKGQKDFENDSFQFSRSTFLLNTVNPFSYKKTANFIKRAEPNLVIFQWWHPFFAPAFWTILKRIGKEIKVIFICHNVLPHERFPFHKLLTKAVLKGADAHIVHSEQDEKNLIGLICNPVYNKAMHPTYGDAFQKNGISRKDARGILGIPEEEKIILFFGFIREYKGLKHLIRAFPAVVSAIPSCKLLIAGEFFENNRSEYLDLIGSTHCEQNICLHSGYIPDNEVKNYFASCDVVVLPYESATQSGIAQVAYGFEKPIIATDVGGLPEVVVDGVTGYIVPPSDDRELAGAIVRFFEAGDAERLTENIRARQDRYDWNRMNEVVEKLYGRIKANE